MKYPHIETGPHRQAKGDPRFRINTAPGIKNGVYEAHSSYLERPQVIELRDELTRWLDANPTDEEVSRRELADAWDDAVEHISQHEADVTYLRHYRRHNPYRKQEEV